MSQCSLFGIDEFDAGARRHQEIVGRFGDVTAMMEPIRIDVRRELLLDLARSRVAPGVDAGVFARCERRHPDEPVDDHQVLR